MYAKVGVFLSGGSDRSVPTNTYKIAWQRLQGETASAEDLLDIDFQIGELRTWADLPSRPSERLDLLLKELGFD